MVDLYNEIKSDIKIQTGGYIEDYPEINYRYIVSCLEYMGLQRVPKLLDDIVDYYPGQKMMNLQLFSEDNEIKIQGILRTLFGEPLYETDNYEDAYCYMIKADDISGNSVLFCVYQGSSGCAIGSIETGVDIAEVIEKFAELVKITQPSDFMYEGNYLDTYTKVKQGIQNGQIVYEEICMDEEKL